MTAKVRPPFGQLELWCRRRADPLRTPRGFRFQESGWDLSNGIFLEWEGILFRRYGQLFRKDGQLYCYNKVGPSKIFGSRKSILWGPSNGMYFEKLTIQAPRQSAETWVDKPISGTRNQIYFYFYQREFHDDHGHRQMRRLRWHQRIYWYGSALLAGDSSRREFVTPLPLVRGISSSRPITTLLFLT